MVAPLIIGAARVARTKSTLKKAEKARAGKSAIVGRRKDRAYDKHAIVNRPKDRKLTLERRAQNVRSVRDILPYRKALRTAGKEASKSTVKKVKLFNRAIVTLGSAAFLMALQPIFALLALFSLAADDSWWGWIDIIDAALIMAAICWVIATMLGAYTMLTATFIMAKYLHHWKVILAWIFCFCANCVPGFQIVPWMGIWVIFIVFHEK